MRARRYNRLEEVEAFFEPYNPEVRDMAYQARSLILRFLPDAWEKVYPNWKLIRYGTSERLTDLVFHVAPRASGVQIGFYQGATLPDPQNLLHGAGKGMRHLMITIAAELQSANLLTMMEAAA